MSNLAEKKCAPCKGNGERLFAEQIKPLLAQLDGWRALEDHHLIKDFSFPDFKSALAFVNKIGAIAEEENHHPDISFTWGKVTVEIWTHKVDGLTENDFVLAAKIDC